MCAVSVVGSAEWIKLQFVLSHSFCRETAAETFLREDILRDMMALRFFGEAKAAICVKRQKAACPAHVPLCVPVDFGGSPS